MDNIEDRLDKLVTEGKTLQVPHVLILEAVEELRKLRSLDRPMSASEARRRAAEMNARLDEAMLRRLTDPLTDHITKVLREAGLFESPVRERIVLESKEDIARRLLKSELRTNAHLTRQAEKLEDEIVRLNGVIRNMKGIPVFIPWREPSNDQKRVEELEKQVKSLEKELRIGRAMVRDLQTKLLDAMNGWASSD